MLTSETAVPPATRAHAAFMVLALLHAAGAVDTLSDALLPGVPVSLPLWLAIYAWCFVLLFIRHGIAWISWLLWCRPLLLVMVAAACASYLWSINPDSTFQRSVHLTGSTLLAIYIGFHFPVRTILNLLTTVFSILLFGGLFAVALFPEIALQTSDGDAVWRGLQTDKNAFGFTAALTALFMFARGFAADVSYRSFYLIAGSVAMIALAMSSSATSIAAFAAGALTMLTFSLVTFGRIPGFVAVLVLAVGIVMLTVGHAIVGPAAIAEVIGKSLDFTGRIEVWDAAWNLVERRPWAGFGYGAVWFPKLDMFEHQSSLLGTTWSASHAHNGFLQIASELGLIIAGVAVVFVLRVLSEPVRLYLQHPSPLLLFAIGLQVAFAVGNMSEARLLIDRNLHWVVYIILAVALLRSAQHLGWLRTGSVRLQHSAG